MRSIPDLLVVFDTDHFATWWYQKLPVFAIGIAPETWGRAGMIGRVSRYFLTSPSPRISDAICTSPASTTGST